MLLVVFWHAGIGFLMPGGFVGVDVFFVISGFLITGILLSGPRRGYVSLSRLLRAARPANPSGRRVTLVASDIAAPLPATSFGPRRPWRTASGHPSSPPTSILRTHGTDYFSQGQPPSPLQHYWSLAVEEQFYLVWPALLSLVLFGAVFSRRPRRDRQVGTLSRRALSRLLLVIVVAATASVIWSVHSTRLHPASTYFSTFARAWELALGAALAIAAPRLRRVPAALGVAVGWLGVIGIVCAAVIYSDNTQFPGYAALLPTVGAALVIGAGISERQSRLRAGRILSLRLCATWVTGLRVLSLALAGVDHRGQYVGHDLSVGVKVLLLLGAFMLSILSYGLFENPLRQMRWRAPVGALLWPASVAVVLGHRGR